MQTSFSENQLKDKENKSSEQILRKCVHCGMCNATCPTYEIIGDELDGQGVEFTLSKTCWKTISQQTKKHPSTSIDVYHAMRV